MPPLHVFNESKKRFEPTEKKCQFCMTNECRNMEDNYFVPLYKEQDRTNIIVYRSVKYNTIPIGIPRCNECMEIHESTANTAKLYAWAAAAAVVLLSVFSWGILGIFSFLPAIFLGFFASTFIENKLVEQKGILPKMEGAKSDETVQDFVIHGWTFTAPSA